jgi:hypothetical protein
VAITFPSPLSPPYLSPLLAAGRHGLGRQLTARGARQYGRGAGRGRAQAVAVQAGPGGGETAGHGGQDGGGTARLAGAGGRAEAGGASCGPRRGAGERTRRAPSQGGARRMGAQQRQAAAAWAERCASVRGRWMRSARSGEVRCRRVAGAEGTWLVNRWRGCGGGVVARPRNEASVRRMAAGRRWCMAREQTRRERGQVMWLGRSRQQERGACVGGVEVHGSERVRAGE